MNKKNNLISICLLIILLIMFTAYNKYQSKANDLIILKERLLDYTIYKNDGNQIIYGISKYLDKEDSIYGKEFVVYNIEGNSSTSLIYKQDIHQIKPWMIDIGDMDGDEDIDVFIGAVTETFVYEEARRPFLFSFNGEILYKKWTGSYLTYDNYEEAYLIDVTGDGYQELVVYEGFKDKPIETYQYNAYQFKNYTMHRIEIEEDIIKNKLNEKEDM